MMMDVILIEDDGVSKATFFGGFEADWASLLRFPIARW